MAATSMTGEDTARQAQQIGWRAAKAMRAENTPGGDRDVSMRAQDAQTTAAGRVLDAAVPRVR